MRKRLSASAEACGLRVSHCNPLLNISSWRLQSRLINVGSNQKSKEQVAKVIRHKAASPPLHSAHPSPETKQHLDLFSHFCTAHRSVIGHARARPFRWKLLILMVRTGPPSNTWFNQLTRATALWYIYADMAYNHIMSPCLHSYTITFYWLHGYRVLTGVEIRYSTR